MLKILVKAQELWDEENNTFINLNKDYVLCLEHSLVSLSKWESKWHKPFLAKDKRTPEEIMDYIKCMTINQNVNSDVYNLLTTEHYSQIEEYIQNPMTATTFSNRYNRSSNREIMTSEIIYYYMICLNIPVEFQKWHLNRLITLIRVCSIKQDNLNKKNKMSRNEILRNNAALNASRRKKFNTKG